MSDNYSLWSQAPLQRYASDQELLKHCAQYGALAPSTHNTQPWLCRITDGALVVSPDNTKLLPFGDPSSRGMYVSLGCFLTNVRVAAAHHKRSISVAFTTKKGELSLQIRLTDWNEKDKLYQRLFRQLTRRLSNKFPYSETKIPPKILKLLQLATDTYTVKITDQPDKILAAARQYEVSAGRLANTQGFRREIASWLRYNKTSKYDGMPGFVSGISDILSLIGPTLLRSIGRVALIQVKNDAAKLAHSPAYGVIYSKNNTRPDWVRVGELYERVALLACAVGISITPLAAMIEDQESAAALAEKHLQAQFFFRLGYSGRAYLPRHTPRRPIVFDG